MSVVDVPPVADGLDDQDVEAVGHRRNVYDRHLPP
jgi:hypothetical protein